MTDHDKQGSRRWALLIGINEYQEWPSKYQLRGCINDVNAIEKLLVSEQFAFPEGNVIKLISPAEDGSTLATRQNILDAIHTQLIDNDEIRADDVVVIYYSGHGSYVPDVDGDEEGRYDQTLVPCDSGPGHENDIIDDEIAELLDALSARTRNINLFFDSCHSGTITRALQDAEEDDAQDRARWLPPPPGVAPSPPIVVSSGARGTRSMDAGGWMPLGQGYVVISACHASERARERRFQLFKRHGILTYCLLKALRDAGPGTAYHDIWQDVRREVNKYCRSQHPQLEGAFERAVFGGAVLPRKRYVEVLDTADDSVTLAAGLVHGATVGSRFAIYPEGTETFEDKSGRLATVELDRVAAFHATATLESGDLSQVAAGCPTIEIEHDYGRMQMIVQVVGDGPVLEQVRQQATASPLLSLAEEGEQETIATVRLRFPVRPDGSKDTARGEMLCILSSGDGHRLVEPVPPDEQGAQTVRDKLEHIAKYHNLLAIRNTDPDSQLAGKVKVRLLKRILHDGQEERVPVTPDQGGNILLQVGDRLIVQVENKSEQTVHAAVFDCGPNWEVLPIFPPQGASDDKVAAHGSRSTIRFCLQHEGLIDERLSLPRETIKIFATTEAADFRSFWLAPARAFEEGTDLARLIGLATGGGTERATRSWERQDGDWTTDELTFQISPDPDISMPV